MAHSLNLVLQVLQLKSAPGDSGDGDGLPMLMATMDVGPAASAWWCCAAANAANVAIISVLGLMSAVNKCVYKERKTTRNLRVLDHRREEFLKVSSHTRPW